MSISLRERCSIHVNCVCLLLWKVFIDNEDPVCRSHRYYAASNWKRNESNKNKNLKKSRSERYFICHFCSLFVPFLLDDFLRAQFLWFPFTSKPMEAVEILSYTISSFFSSSNFNYNVMTWWKMKYASSMNHSQRRLNSTHNKNKISSRYKERNADWMRSMNVAWLTETDCALNDVNELDGIWLFFI